MRHFIWVFTVCQSTCIYLPVSRSEKVKKLLLGFLKMSLKRYLTKCLIFQTTGVELMVKQINIPDTKDAVVMVHLILLNVTRLNKQTFSV